MMRVIFAFAAIILQLSPAIAVECPETGLTFIRDPQSCVSFFKCINGVAFLLECPKGLYFDENSGFCDRPENVNCIIEDEPDTEALPEPTPDTEIETTPGGEPEIIPDGEIIPDEESETTSDEEPETIPDKVPTTTTSEDDSGTTSYEEFETTPVDELETVPNEDEESETIPDAELTTTPDEESVTSPDEELVTTPDDGPEITEPEDIECPETGLAFIRNPQSCVSFFKCLNGVAFLLECPRGLYFDENSGFCDRPENVNCITEGLPDEPDFEKPDTEADPEPTPDAEIETTPGGEPETIPDEELETETIPDDGPETITPEDDSGTTSDEEPETTPVDELITIPTENGEPETTPDEELVTTPNEETETASDEEYETTPEITEPEYEFCPPEGQHFFPYPNSCYKFIECMNGIKRVLECFGDLHFNPELGFCDFPENANCVITTPEPSPEHERPESGPVGECPPENEGIGYYLPDSASCYIFYQCNWGKPMPQNCPPRLHFNPVEMICDWPEYAGCKVPYY